MSWAIKIKVQRQDLQIFPIKNNSTNVIDQFLAVDGLADGRRPDLTVRHFAGILIPRS